MKWARRILLLVVLVALPIGGHLFVTRNAEPIAIDYLAGRLEGVPVWASVLGCFAAGAVVGWLFALLLGARRALEARRYRKAVRALEAEVHQLRNLPLSPEEAVPIAEDASAADDEATPAHDEADQGLTAEPQAQAAGLERGT